MCNHAFLLTHILSAGSNPADSCSRFSLLNPPWVAGEAELVTQEENQALGGGKGNVRDSADPGGAGAERHVRFLFCRDSCKPEPLAGIEPGRRFQRLCALLEIGQLFSTADGLCILMLDFEVPGPWGGVQNQRQGAEFPASPNKSQKIQWAEYTAPHRLLHMKCWHWLYNVTAPLPCPRRMWMDACCKKELTSNWCSQSWMHLGSLSSYLLPFCRVSSRQGLGMVGIPSKNPFSLNLPSLLLKPVILQNQIWNLLKFTFLLTQEHLGASPCFKRLFF